jgi:hypothetical protein
LVAKNKPHVFLYGAFLCQLTMRYRAINDKLVPLLFVPFIKAWRMDVQTLPF